MSQFRSDEPSSDASAGVVGLADGLALPNRVSSDGREIWDWAARFSQHMHRLDEARRLRSEVATVECGGCTKWMKSRACPRERNVNGWNRGPSSRDRICGQFVETRSSAERRAANTEKLAEIEAELRCVAP